MKRIGLRVGLLAALGILAAGASEVALAHTRVGVGVVVGSPIGWGWYGPRPYYYYPAYYPAYYPGPVVAPSSPPTYIEAAPTAPASAPNVWYYCNNPDGYYPYIKQCPGGWQTVSPQPPQQ